MQEETTSPSPDETPRRRDFAVSVLPNDNQLLTTTVFQEFPFFYWLPGFSVRLKCCQDKFFLVFYLKYICVEISWTYLFLCAISAHYSNQA